VQEKLSRRAASKRYYDRPLLKNYANKTILIVDDEKEIRELIRETLTIDDFHVLEANSGEQALQLVSQENPDLVLLDVAMPGSYDGIEVSRRIKTNTRTQQISVIFLTAVPLDDFQDRQVFADDVFYKPFSPIKLVNRIHAILDRAD